MLPPESIEHQLVAGFLAENDSALAELGKNSYVHYKTRQFDILLALTRYVTSRTKTKGRETA